MHYCQMIYQLVAHVENFVLRVPGHASASDALIAVFVRHADAAGLEISAGITRNGGQREKKEEAEVYWNDMMINESSARDLGVVQ